MEGRLAVSRVLVNINNKMKGYNVLMLAACVFCILLLCSCASEPEEYDYDIYYINKEENQLIAQGYNAVSDTTEDLIDELLDRLNITPEDDDAMIPGLDISKIKKHIYSEKGYVVLDFDSNYFTLDIIKETLCRAAIVKTLCQIEGVEGVEFFIDGNPHLDYSGNPYGYMTAETFVDNTSGETTYKQTISVNLYFADSKGKKLVKVPTNVTFDGTISIEQLIMQQIISGPSSVNGVDSSLKAVVPATTVVNQITVREQICYIDLNKEFLTSMDGVSREVSLYSVVNALAELPDINKVQFTIDGETVNYFGSSSIVFDSPLERNLEIIKE